MEAYTTVYTTAYTTVCCRCHVASYAMPSRHGYSLNIYGQFTDIAITSEMYFVTVWYIRHHQQQQQLTANVCVWVCLSVCLCVCVSVRSRWSVKWPRWGRRTVACEMTKVWSRRTVISVKWARRWGRRAMSGLVGQKITIIYRGSRCRWLSDCYFHINAVKLQLFSCKKLFKIDICCKKYTTRTQHHQQRHHHHYHRVHHQHFLIWF